MTDETQSPPAAPEQKVPISLEEEIKCCVARRTLTKTVPIQPYDAPSTLQVLFLPNDEIEVWATRYDLGHPDHPSKRDYPKTPNPVPQES